MKLNAKSRYIDYVYSSFFKFPYISQEDIYTAPDWISDTIWYQIFVDRFAKSNNPALIKGKLCDWNEEVKKTDVQLFGGDLCGIIEKLDYIEELGITGIYLTPIFHSVPDKCHRYEVVDYFNIDPAFGTNEIFKELVEKAHKRNIKIIIDFIANHCSKEHRFFKDALEKGTSSAYYDCFFFENDSYTAFSDYDWMPKWNTANPTARHHLISAAVHWAEKFGIDGYRLDVANEGSHDFWREFRKAVKAVNPEIFIVGEVWEHGGAWLSGAEWDSCMHYPLSSVLHRYLRGNTDAKELAEQIALTLVSYPKNVTKNLFTILGTHDTSRIMTFAGGNAALVKQAFAICMTLPGSPCIFAGDEIGLEGKGNDLSRQCMKWDDEDRNLDMLKFMKKIIDMRKTNPAMRAVDVSWLYSEKDCVIYEKSVSGNRIAVILNCIDKENSIDISNIITAERANNLLTGNETEFTEPLLIEKFGIRIFELF